MSWWPSFGVTVVMVGFVAGVSGCSAGQAPTDAFSGPYGPQMKAAYEAATDPAVKSALQDGKITRAEYDAAVQRYVACAADQGVTITPHEQDGLYNYEVVREPNTDAVIDSCTPVIQTIESLYSSMLKNPENRNMEDVIADCLKRAGLVPRDYTGEKFASDMKAGTGLFGSQSLDPAVSRCLNNPQATPGDGG